MKNYSTPSMTTMNVEIENVILAGSTPAPYDPWGKGGVTYTYYPVQGSNGETFAWDKQKKIWIDQAGNPCPYDTTGWLESLL